MYPYVELFSFRIPSYGLCMTLAIFLCGFLSIKRARKVGVSFEDMIIVAAASIGAGLLCGGILYVAVTYSVEEILGFIKKGDFSFINNVGLVFYGALIGGVSGGLICAKLLKIEIAALERSVICYIPLGHSIGRIGCLLAGCCHGFQYDGIFAVQSRLISGSVTYFPIQLVEALGNLLIMVCLLIYTKKERPAYFSLILYLMMYSVLRFLLEFFRGDEIRGGFLAFSTSQWISIFILIICVAGKILLLIKRRKFEANSV